MNNKLLIGLGLVALVNACSPNYTGMNAKQLRESISTWDEAKDYIENNLTYMYDDVNYGTEDHYVSLGTIIRSRHEDCDGGAVVGAALLMDDHNYGVSGLELHIKSKREVKKIEGKYFSDKNYGSHWVTLVRDKMTGRYGALGINNVDMVEPDYATPNDVFDIINDRFDNIFENFSTFQWDFKKLMKNKDGSRPVSYYYSKN